MSSNIYCTEANRAMSSGNRVNGRNGKNSLPNSQSLKKVKVPVDLLISSPSQRYANRLRRKTSSSVMELLDICVYVYVHILYKLCNYYVLFFQDDYIPYPRIEEVRLNFTTLSLDAHLHTLPAVCCRC